MGGLLVDPAQPTVVGIWGNSDALNINDWIEVQLARPGRRGSASLATLSSSPLTFPPLSSPQIVMDSNTTEMVWDQGTATCTNVITGMKMEFLTSVVGASHNPQSQITYARISFVRATWTFQGRLLTPDKPEMFQVTTSPSSRKSVLCLGGGASWNHRRSYWVGKGTVVFAPRKLKRFATSLIMGAVCSMFKLLGFGAQCVGPRGSALVCTRVPVGVPWGSASMAYAATPEHPVSGRLGGS